MAETLPQKATELAKKLNTEKATQLPIYAKIVSVIKRHSQQLLNG